MFNCKKLLSLALAATMAASLAVPAFAAETTESTGEKTTNTALKIDGFYQATPVSVVVPESGKVIINPYALPCEIVAKTTDAAAIKVENQQIVTTPMAIKNKSEVALNVNVSYTAKTSGSLTLATAPISDVTTDTKNDAFVYLVIEETELTDDSTIDSTYASQEWTAYSTGSDAPKNILALKSTTTAISATKLATLAKPDLTDDGDFSAYTAGSIAFVSLKGSCAQSPKTAWTVKDGLTVNLAFTFTPATDA
jgi:hypothetical protein